MQIYPHDQMRVQKVYRIVYKLYLFKKNSILKGNIKNQITISDTQLYLLVAINAEIFI